MEPNIDKKRSYIYFTIGSEYYAILVNSVLEIKLKENITHIPNSSPYIKGVLNFRGDVVPVINMHHRFNMSEDEDAGNMIIIIDMEDETGEGHILMGLLVDEVKDVLEFRYRDIRKTPQEGIKYNPEYLEGMTEFNGNFILILNVSKVLNTAELSSVEENVAA